MVTYINNNLWYLHTMEYYFAIKINDLYSYNRAPIYVLCKKQASVTQNACEKRQEKNIKKRKKKKERKKEEGEGMEGKKKGRKERRKRGKEEERNND